MKLHFTDQRPSLFSKAMNFQGPLCVPANFNHIEDIYFSAILCKLYISTLRCLKNGNISTTTSCGNCSNIVVGSNHSNINITNFLIQSSPPRHLGKSSRVA